VRQYARPAIAVAIVALLPVVRLHSQPAAPVAGPTVAFPGSAARLDLAYASLERHQLAGAREHFNALLADDTLSTAERARALRGLGIVQFHANQKDESARSLQQAIEMATAARAPAERAWARRWLGVLRYDADAAEVARTLWSTARDEFVDAGDLRGEFQVTDDLTQLLHGLAQRPLVERCHAIALELGDPVLEARARRRWARTLLFAARPGPALVELERAVALLRAAGPSARMQLADTLSTLGWALRAHGANERSVAVHREALRLARAGNDLNAQVWNNQGLAIALTELGRYAEAETAMHRGLAAARRLGPSTPVRTLTESLAWIALRQQRWADAARALESAMAMPGREVAVTPVINLARAYRHLDRLEEARRQAERAVSLARAQSLVDNELRALVELSVVHEQLGQLTDAAQTISEVIDRLEHYRSSLAPQDFLKQGFADRFTDAYGIAVRVRMRGGQLLEALTAAERIRSRAFADLLASRRQRQAEEAEADSKIWNLGGDSVGQASRGAEAFDSPRAVPALDARALGTLAARLDSTLVLYWIHDEGSFAWVVQPSGAVHAATLSTTPARTRRAVARVADAPPEVEIAATAANAASARGADRTPYRLLYQMLWAPIEPWLPTGTDARVTVIPHGPLFAVPFGALLDAHDKYVLERFALHYASSGAALAEAAGPRVHAAQTRHVVIADPRPVPPEPSGVRLPSLSGARREARTVASLLGPEVQMVVGADATERAVRAAMPGAPTLHFATHAIVSDRDPLGSHLLLGVDTGAKPTPDTDGRLTATEIAELTLSADLVVLGACRSARGQVSSDGIAGLTRSFMTAGAPSVIATLWDISDDTTARVMTRFYEGYGQGLAKDRALRRAQLAVLGDLRNGRVRRKVGSTTITFHEHPHLWAGAVLLGAP
jgi:CHAT domain-containing protein